MNKNRGQIFRTEKEQYAVMKYHEQQTKWMKEDKLLVHLYKDHLLQDPVIDDKGRPAKVIKRRSTLTPVGYID